MFSPESGRMLSHYRLAEEIGKGGMGVVWKAEDTVLERTVAIKFLHENVATDPKRREMFYKEARSASKLSQAHIVQVYEFGHEDGLDFIVMEFVEGEPLGRIIKKGPLSPDRVADVGLQVARGMAKAHQKRLLHRDLKPSNILVTPEWEAKLVDFGLAPLPPDLEDLLDCRCARVPGWFDENNRAQTDWNVLLQAIE